MFENGQDSYSDNCERSVMDELESLTGQGRPEKVSLRAAFHLAMPHIMDEMGIVGTPSGSSKLLKGGTLSSYAPTALELIRLLRRCGDSKRYVSRYDEVNNLKFPPLDPLSVAENAVVSTHLKLVERFCHHLIDSEAEVTSIILREPVGAYPGRASTFLRKLDKWVWGNGACYWDGEVMTDLHHLVPDYKSSSAAIYKVTPHLKSPEEPEVNLRQEFSNIRVETEQLLEYYPVKLGGSFCLKRPRSNSVPTPTPHTTTCGGLPNSSGEGQTAPGNPAESASGGSEQELMGGYLASLYLVGASKLCVNYEKAIGVKEVDSKAKGTLVKRSKGAAMIAFLVSNPNDWHVLEVVEKASDLILEGKYEPSTSKLEARAIVLKSGIDVDSERAMSSKQESGKYDRNLYSRIRNQIRTAIQQIVELYPDLSKHLALQSQKEPVYPGHETIKLENMRLIYCQPAGIEWDTTRKCG